MRKVMAPLVIVNLMLAMMFLGYAIMVSYSGSYKPAARIANLQKQVSDLKKQKEDLEGAKGDGGLRTAGLLFINQEAGKSEALLKDIETKRYSAARDPINKEVADRNKELKASSDENLLALEKDLSEKLRTEKDLRVKIVQGRKDLADARTKNEGREAQKAELQNRLVQQGHLLDIVKGRAEQVGAMVKQFEAAPAERQP